MQGILSTLANGQCECIDTGASHKIPTSIPTSKSSNINLKSKPRTPEHTYPDPSILNQRTKTPASRKSAKT
ncbi:uncharacterized protein BDW43DRAFT_102112 [Aspergillus alliaceus]|uniref:uncharacterized protein n=1 Tax=Petromyces alliaceus TaxID=209559 RepID=UPI0012A47569|nr:uncharacterized protein BDW43DRAFT_102112 [Aspergillus alliaceus]KAB8232720.1 hypothetical protein BDW43DRAFT_102112 [Aspergillus alliaceus]